MPLNQIMKIQKQKKLFNPGSTFRLGGIDWLVLDSNNARVFCITKNCVDYMVYSETGENTYDYSIIAQYLTKEFISYLEKSIDFSREFLISHKTNIAKLYDDSCPEYKYYSIRLLTYKEYVNYRQLKQSASRSTTPTSRVSTSYFRSSYGSDLFFSLSDLIRCSVCLLQHYGLG